MKKLSIAGLWVALPLSLSVLAAQSRKDADARVVQIKLPPEDYSLMYLEREHFTVKLEGKSASVEAVELYVGDGEVAVPLKADPTKGIFLQGKHQPQGTQFKRGSHVQLEAGYQLASDLRPGQIYVVLPVIFDLP